jgi:hypothetical protein
MTFNDALLHALDGALVRRAGWTDPERVAYRVLVGDHDDSRYYTMNVTEEDTKHDDWYFCGWLH